MTVLAFAPPREPARLVTPNGAVVAVSQHDGKDRVTISGPAELRIDIDPATGRATVTSAARTLALAADGDVELAARGKLRLSGAEGVELEGKTLAVTAGRASLGIVDLRYAGEAVAAKLDRLGLDVDRIETVAERVVERAKNVYRRAEELYQQQAGRMRTLVEGGFALRSGHASLCSREETKIDGKQIHLG